MKLKLKRKEKEIKYYAGEETVKVKEKIEKKIAKLQQKRNKATETITAEFNSNKITKRRQRKIVKLSTVITRLDIKTKRNQELLRLLELGQLEKLSPYNQFKQWFSGIEYTKQTMIWGFVFIIPWAFGMIVLFIPSVLETLFWSFSSTNLTPAGMETSFVGFKNFVFLFTEYVVDGNNVFSVSLLSFIEGLLIDLPVIIIFSILIAVMLNKPFKGHKLIKAIFFIPVVYNMQVINETLNGIFGQHFSQNTEQDVTFVAQVTAFILDIGIGGKLIDVVLSAVQRIFTIVNLSGIQILIFVAAIQSIPAHLYEAAEIEGATKYEIFWKITVPMITPMILTAAVYTIVDSFSRAPITRFLQQAVAAGNYGLGAAVSISYFLINLVLVGFIFLLFKGRVFYYDEQR